MTRRRRLRVAAGCALGLALVAAWARLGPLPAGLLATSAASSTLVTDRHGAPLYETRDADGGRSVRLEAGALPGILVDATMAAEDRRFMRHPGVDPIAVLRAAWHNARSGGWVEGGSTLTQQVVKLLQARREPHPPRGLLAKAREAGEAELGRMKAELRKEFGRLVVEASKRATGGLLTSEQQTRLADQSIRELAA